MVGYMNMGIHERLRESVGQANSGQVQPRPPHPEDYCDECAQPNFSWWVDSELWNLAVPDRVPILCPTCFVTRYELMTGKTFTWELRRG